MDGQLSTWMDWIWSSSCLALSCTSTQSSYFKWVSGGGINSPRHQTSSWLTTTEKVSVGWTDAMIFQGVSSSGVLHVTYPLHLRWNNCSDAMLRRSFGSSGAEGLVAKTSLLVSSWPSDGPTLPLTMTSVHPMLKASSWRVSVLIQTERQIDRRCPHLDCRFIRCYCLLLLCLFHSSGATRKHTIGSSDSLCKLSFLHAVYQVHRWYRRFIRRCQFPSFSSAVLTLEI
jgi:hypothetical protein